MARGTRTSYSLSRKVLKLSIAKKYRKVAINGIIGFIGILSMIDRQN